MNNKNFKGEITAQKPEVQSEVIVYYVASKFSYATEVNSIKFSNKENADTFINLMKAEGYEITTFAGEGYLGEEAEAEKRDAIADDLNIEYQAKIEALAEEHRDNELEVLEEAAEIYNEYTQAICDLYGCEAGGGDGFCLDLTSLGDEFFCSPNPGWDEMCWQLEHLYERIDDLKYAEQFEPVTR